MNAILQCIVHTPLLKNYFISGIFLNHINKKAIVNSKGVLAEIIAEFFREYVNTNDPIASLRKVKNTIAKCIPQFQGYDQHDAQEVLYLHYPLVSSNDH